MSVTDIWIESTLGRFTPYLDGIQFACNIWFGAENHHHHHNIDHDRDHHDDHDDHDGDIECLWLMLIPVLTGD